ncbi:MAG: sigma-70 family RNA polymerase sigma factor [Saprospiraceae bacterium]|nr:sigma-70 family RNA polymerase sigma factor [Saprospiraceae bacterium]
MDQNELLDLLRKGDKTAFKQLYINLGETTRGFISKRGGDHEMVRDVLQEGLYRLLMYLKKHSDLELKSSIEALAFGFIKNVWLEKIRSSDRHKIVELGESPDQQEIMDEGILFGEGENDRELKVIGSLLDQLGENCKVVLIEFYVHRLKLKEIANKLSLSESYIKLKRFRCLNELKEKYQAIAS